MTDEDGRGTHRKRKVNSVTKAVSKKEKRAHGPVIGGHIKYPFGVSLGTIDHMAVVVHGAH